VTGGKKTYIEMFDSFTEPFNSFTVKFIKVLWRKVELKLAPLHKAVAALPCKKQVVNYTALQHS